MKGIVIEETIIPVAILEKKLVTMAQIKMMTNMNTGKLMLEKSGVRTSVNHVRTPKSGALSAPPMIMNMPIVQMNPQFAPSLKNFLQSMRGLPLIFTMERTTMTKTNQMACVMGERKAYAELSCGRKCRTKE